MERMAWMKEMCKKQKKNSVMDTQTHRAQQSSFECIFLSYLRHFCFCCCLSEKRVEYQFRGESIDSNSK